MSSRIPDFVRLRQYNSFSANRVDLLVEVKRLPRTTNDRFTLRQKIMQQAEVQAFHAFQAPTPSFLSQSAFKYWVTNGYTRKYSVRKRLTDLLRAQRRDRDHTYELSPSVDGSGQDNSPNTSETNGPPNHPPLQIQLDKGKWLYFTETRLAQQKEWLRQIGDQLEVVGKDRIEKRYRVRANKKQTISEYPDTMSLSSIVNQEKMMLVQMILRQQPIMKRGAKAEQGKKSGNSVDSTEAGTSVESVFPY